MLSYNNKNKKEDQHMTKLNLQKLVAYLVDELRNLGMDHKDLSYILRLHGMSDQDILEYYGITSN